MSEKDKLKVTAYVYANYKDYADKEIVIEDKGNIIAVKKHKNGTILFLNKQILD
jgi:hypothetical protein